MKVGASRSFDWFGGHDYVRLWAAGSISGLGTAVTTVALPLLALVDLHATTFEVGIVSASGLIAWLLFGLSAGVWVERATRRPLMITCDVVRAGALLSVPAAAWLGVLTLAQVAVVALVIGVCSVFFDVANHAYLPSILEPGELLAGNSRLQASESAVHTAGPAVGGLLVQLLSAPLTLVIDAVSYLTSAVCLSRVRKREPPASRSEPGDMVAEIRVGLAYVLRDPIIRPLMLVAASLNFLGAAFDTLLVPFLLRTVGVSATLIGVLLAVSGVGGILGAGVGPLLTRKVGNARAVYIAVFVGPPLALLVPLGAPGLGLALLAVGLLVREACIGTFSLLARTYRQTSVPRELLARVIATVRFVSWGVLPIGALMGGLLGQALGNRGALWVVCAALLLTPLPLVAIRPSHRRDLVHNLDHPAVAAGVVTDKAGSDDDRKE